MKSESQQASGVPLQKEQLLLISSRAAVEKSLGELESIRSQLEEVAREVMLP